MFTTKAETTFKDDNIHRSQQVTYKGECSGGEITRNAEARTVCNDSEPARESFPFFLFRW